MEAATAPSLAYYAALTGAGAYAVLFVYVLVGLVRGATGRALLIAVGVTGVAVGARVVEALTPYLDLLDVASYGAWYGVVLRVLGVGRATLGSSEFRKQYQLAYASAAAVSVALLVCGIATFFGPPDGTVALVVPIAKLLMNVLGLALVEQLFRNTRRDFQWNMKFMSFGLGLIFGFGFVDYANRVLFGSPNASFDSVAGFVYALAVPFVIIASSRNSRHVLNINISRDFVLRSGVLFGTGAYLLAMSAAGYYLRAVGSSWGEALQVLFVVVSLLALAVIASSTQVRNYIRVVIERNLFEYKYDYRNEWRRITHTLTRPDADLSLGQRVVLSLADILHVREGALYWREEDGRLLQDARYGGSWEFDIDLADSDAMVAFWRERDWIVDMDEYRNDPAVYRELPLSRAFVDQRDVRFVVPLLVNDELLGLVLLGQPTISIALIWEDYDLLKVAGRQAASVMAQHRAAAALNSAQQFEAFHRMSAFIVHDIKTVVAQLSLLVKNAEKHKANPAFIEDMLRTSDNAARRMQKLLDQLRDPKPEALGERLDVREVVIRAIERQARNKPAPRLLGTPDDPVWVVASDDQLCNVVGHILQNAQDATPAHGQISVSIECDASGCAIRIEDTGAGMDETFLRDRLFNPFDSTKGVAGMGIGAYQSRQYARSIGGDLRAVSVVGKGSCFVLTLPAVRETPSLRTSDGASPA